MNCYECTLAGKTIPAVGICRDCGVGVCIEHLREAQRYRVGGTVFGCAHGLAEVGLLRRGLVVGTDARSDRTKAASPSSR